MRFIWIILIFLTACSSTGGPNQSEQSDHDHTTDQNGTVVQGAGQPDQWTGSPLDDPNSPLFQKTIYFAFDDASLAPEYIDILKAHGHYLNNNPSTHLVIEGHCDERGSREYNIALGERRALAVQRFLEAQGVDPNQLSIISYGEEKPAVLGHDESAWSKNRRAELVYQN